jgi:C-terminal processing protease CtpA/Prc
MKRKFLIALAVMTLTAALGSASAQDERGVFGLAFEIDGEGFILSPTLKTITIKAVTGGMPADLAGIKIGDQIIEVDGKVVAGAKARDMEPYLKKYVGQSIALRLKRPGGEVYAISMVAIAKK